MNQDGRRGTACSRRLLSLDMFGEPFMFLLPDKEYFFSSMPGAICTILLMIISFVFAGYKMNVLAQKSQYDVVRETYEYHFSDTD